MVNIVRCGMKLKGYKIIGLNIAPVSAPFRKLFVVIFEVIVLPVVMICSLSSLETIGRLKLFIVFDVIKTLFNLVLFEIVKSLEAINVLFNIELLLISSVLLS